MTETRIVVIEDEDDLRQELIAQLSEDTQLHFVGDCGSGEEGLKVIEETRPDLVIMDINLPGMSGVECVVRTLQILPDCKIMMYTAFDGADQVFESLRAGACG